MHIEILFCLFYAWDHHKSLKGNCYVDEIIPARISNYIHYKVWDEINYQFLNFNGATVEI